MVSPTRPACIETLRFLSASPCLRLDARLRPVRYATHSHRDELLPPAGALMREFEFTIDNVLARARRSMDAHCCADHQYSRIAPSKVQVRRISITSKSRANPGGNA